MALLFARRSSGEYCEYFMDEEQPSRIRI